MRTLGVSGGWLFFEHAGAAVAVDIASGDVTDVFSVSQLGQATWSSSPSSIDERRASLVARSALAVEADPLRTFAVPDAVRTNARQARHLQQIYDRSIELPLLATGTSLVPPLPVRRAAQRALDFELDPVVRARAEALCSGRAVPERLVAQMHAYFSRHSESDVPEGDWLAWGATPGRKWAERLARAEDRSGTVNKALADDETVGYDTLRLLPRAFSVISSPHELSCQGNGSCRCGGSKSSPGYPSSRALTYLALGGDVGRDWAERTVRRVENAALIAAGYDPDATVLTEETGASTEPVFDGTEPHAYSPMEGMPDRCIYCGLDEFAEIHDDEAVDYSIADITPEDAHYFTEKPRDESSCAICGKAVDDTLHKQAALASYYENKDLIDKMIAETKQYWDGKEQGISAAADIYGVDWSEVEDPEMADLFDRALAVDNDLDTVFWSRRGSEDDDPLTYYATYLGDDSLIVDQLYVNDGSLFYLYDPRQRTWLPTSLNTPEQIYEIDDDSAREVIRAMSFAPKTGVDLRELDPGEALLMAETLPALDFAMLDRVAIASPTGATFDYTPQERAQNAQKQVRDAGGRFAKSGSRVAVGADNRLGVVGKINPQTQQVEVTYDEGGPSHWIDAKDVKVLNGPDEGGNGGPGVSLDDIKKIEGKPRATANTPKALLPTLLPPMDAEAIKSVIENYSSFIEKERAGKAARQKAQDAQDDASRKRYEAEAEKAEADYRRRLEKVHAGGQSARDWIDRVYRKILPGYKRRPTNPLTAAPATALAAPAAGAVLDPAKSDVAPIYMAEVDETNNQAVLELLAMVPASATSTDATLLRRTPTGWEKDEKILRQLRSSAPPAIVVLDEAQYADTLSQVDAFYKTDEGKASEEDKKSADPEAVAASLLYGEYGEILAAGVPGISDTPSDVAATERLKRYWTIGEGGVAKIRWNTPGDMTRCIRNLNKYMPKPGMAEGYCAKLHHEMTGTWPGDKRNIGRRGSAGRRQQIYATKLLNTDEVVAFSALVASANAMCAGVEAPAKVTDVPTTLSGSPFVIPVVAPVGIRSGDGRQFAPLSLTTRDLPLPLMWQIQTAEGHDSAVIVGRIDSMDRAEDGSLVNARGVFDVGPYGQEAERLVRHKFLRGVSVDLDNFEAEARSREVEEAREEMEDNVVRIAADEMTVTNGRVMGVTLVPKPAFQECAIQLEEGQEEEPMVADGTYIGTPITESETEEMIRSALTAAGIPVHPPTSWFKDPELRSETPLTISDDGRVFGHIATWNTDHIGLPFSTRPPHSRSNYAYFHTGLLRTDEGSDVPVGQITLAGGHAPLDADALAAVKHYDDTASAMCDVHAGEDRYGIWVAGALRPSVSAEQVRAIRAASPSGDWRPINGRLELVAVCQVNVPGFPVTRARVASGHVFALVAAGTALLNHKRQAQADSQLDALLERVEALEAPQRAALEEAREAAMARLRPVREEREARLAAAREAALSRFSKTRSPAATAARERIAALMSDDGAAFFRDYSQDKREEMAKRGQAMPGGGYPIATVGDLKNAIRAYGRAASGEKAKVRRHIKKRARALGKTDLIPESWASMSTPVQDIAGEIEDLTAQLALISAGGRYPDGSPWNPQNHPRDEKGKFRQVIAELKSDLEGEAGTADAVEGLDAVQQAAGRGDIDAAQQAAKGVLDLVDKIAANTEDEGAVKTLREGYGNLAEAVANLPLVFGDLNEKYRFSDLPPDLKGLIEDLYKRAEQRLDNEHLAEAGGKISEFMAGGDMLSQPQISAELSRILRFLI